MPSKFAAIEASRLARDPRPELQLQTEPEATRQGSFRHVRRDWAVFRGARPVRMKLTAMDAHALARQLTADSGREHVAHTVAGMTGWRRHPRTPPRSALTQLRRTLNKMGDL